jgi:hypothetical protein
VFRTDRIDEVAAGNWLCRIGRWMQQGARGGGADAAGASVVGTSACRCGEWRCRASASRQSDECQGASKGTGRTAARGRTVGIEALMIRGGARTLAAESDDDDRQGEIKRNQMERKTTTELNYVP